MVRNNSRLVTLNIEEKKKQRFEFLYALYHIADGKEYAYKDTFEIGRICRFDKDLTLNVVGYLKGEGLVDYLDFGNQVAITHSGVIHIEDALSRPKAETKYFPPTEGVNINIIHNMANSLIQQNSPLAQQTVLTLNDTNLQDIYEIIRLLNEFISTGELDAEFRTDLDTEARRMNIELSNVRPKSRILCASLLCAKDILDNLEDASFLKTSLRTKINKLLNT
jgi:hypothetical protein